MKKNNQNELILTQPKTVGSQMIFHIYTKSFEDPNEQIRLNQMKIYQEQLKWNFRNLMITELSKIIIAFTEAVKENAINQYNKAENADIPMYECDLPVFFVDPYNVIKDAPFLMDINWWMGVFNTIGVDNHGNLLDHPFIDMTAANLYGGIVNRIFLCSPYVRTRINIERILQKTIEDSYDFIINGIKRTYQFAYDTIMMWEDILDREYDKLPDKNDTTPDMHTNTHECRHCGHCHNE